MFSLPENIPRPVHGFRSSFRLPRGVRSWITETGPHLPRTQAGVFLPRWAGTGVSTGSRRKPGEGAQGPRGIPAPRPRPLHPNLPSAFIHGVLCSTLAASPLPPPGLAIPGSDLGLSTQPRVSTTTLVPWNTEPASALPSSSCGWGRGTPSGPPLCPSAWHRLGTDEVRGQPSLLQ